MILKAEAILRVMRSKIVVPAIFETKLRPRFIASFPYMANEGLAYTLNFPRKLCTHLVFYVGMLKSYRHPNHVNVEALAPRAATFELVRQADPPSEAVAVPVSAAASAPLSACPESETNSHGDVSLRKSTRRAFAPIYRHPTTLLDEHGSLQFHVEKLLRKRRRKGQHQYLVDWRGCSESYKSWELYRPLRQNCPYAVDVF